jgi:hypothetical protein
LRNYRASRKQRAGAWWWNIKKLTGRTNNHLSSEEKKEQELRQKAHDFVYIGRLKGWGNATLKSLLRPSNIITLCSDFSSKYFHLDEATFQNKIFKEEVEFITGDGSSETVNPSKDVLNPNHHAILTKNLPYDVYRYLQ